MYTLTILVVIMVVISQDWRFQLRFLTFSGLDEGEIIDKACPTHHLTDASA